MRSVYRWFVPVLGTLAVIYLIIPIAYIFAFSFNDSGKTNLTWQGFTLSNWANPCSVPNICTAVTNSIQIGFMATAISLVLGTCIALSLVRYRLKFTGIANSLIFMPLAAPEVVMAAALLAQFLNANVPLGKGTIVIAHATFCISLVVVTVKARLVSLDPRLEEAAADLYASPSQVFWRVTFPLLLPGIVAAGLLSFAMSFDDFIITNFNSGAVETFPKYIYAAAARGIPAQANVIASAVFIIAIAIVVLQQIVAARRAKALAG